MKPTERHDLRLARLRVETIGVISMKISIKNIVPAALCSLLVGCASISGPFYVWEKTSAASTTSEWRDVGEHVYGHCRVLPHVKSVLACARPNKNGHCIIYSSVSVVAAKKKIVDGMSLYAHEMKHCAGYVHQDAHPKSLADIKLVRF